MLKLREALLTPVAPCLSVSHLGVCGWVFDEPIGGDGVKPSSAASLIQMDHSRLAHHFIREEPLVQPRGISWLIEGVPLPIRFCDAQEVSGAMQHQVLRSEERRVGKECRSRWSP